MLPFESYSEREKKLFFPQSHQHRPEEALSDLRPASEPIELS